jgi:uncharacterized protein involved in exopolysaccharide biosynthesis
MILLPETDKSKVAGLAGLSNLAALAGINVGEVALEQLYPSIINSETILKKVIYSKYIIPSSENNPKTLIEYWEIDEETEVENYEKALKKLRDDLDVSLNKVNNIVTINIWTTDAQLSSDILDSISLNVDEFIRVKRITNASEQRRWIENRLNSVKNDLKNSEEDFKNFRLKNRRILDSPELILVQDRLSREVLMHSSLYSELRKQYELAKIEEIKNIPIINVLDYSRPAGKKDRPKRIIINIVSFLFNTVLILGFTIVKTSISRRNK